MAERYETFPGWEEDISKITKYADLPAKCRAYVERIEVLLECPVRYACSMPCTLPIAVDSI